MLRSQIYLSILCVTLIAVLNITCNYTLQGNIDEKKAILEKVTIPLHGIDIHDNDYRDFSFLDEVLLDKRIVFLGEQLHADGTTFEVKSKIIKYMHENLGYNVVLYEAGLYDMWYMEAQGTVEPKLGLYAFWWDNDEYRQLWDYYQKSKQTENPILLGGFDVQLTGQIKETVRRALIENYLSSKNIDLSDYPAFDKNPKRVFQHWYWENRKFQTSLNDSIQMDLSLILSKLEESDNSTHLPFKSMGTYLKERYGNEAYSMAFTSYARKNKDGHLYNVASNKSIEYVLHLNNNNYAFIDLKNIEEESFLDKDIISTVNQMLSMKNNWKNQFDGLFFIHAITSISTKK